MALKVTPGIPHKKVVCILFFQDLVQLPVNKTTQPEYQAWVNFIVADENEINMEEIHRTLVQALDIPEENIGIKHIYTRDINAESYKYETLNLKGIFEFQHGTLIHTFCRYLIANPRPGDRDFLLFLKKTGFAEEQNAQQHVDAALKQIKQ